MFLKYLRNEKLDEKNKIGFTKKKNFFFQDMFLKLAMFAGGHKLLLGNKEEFLLTGKNFANFFFKEMEKVCPHFFNEVTSDQKNWIRKQFTHTLSHINQTKTQRGTVQSTIPVTG